MFIKKDKPSILVNNVNHYFGTGENKKQVLYQNNLKIHRGEIVIMTGPSGSGKTTLLTLIGALRSVQEGSIKILGQELLGLKLKEQVEIRKNIGFIFQAHNLFESLTARQNVNMAMELNNISGSEKKRRATEILTQLGLGERINYKPQNLSGGQKQRVAIARALVNKPKLVLADEPTAALDEKTGHEVMELLKVLATEEGCTVIIVTHDNRIINVADRLVNLIDGSITSDINVKEAMYICQFIKKSEIFEHMSPSELTDMSQKMNHEYFEPGEIIIRQGDTGDKFYMIYTGTAEVYMTENNKEEKIASLTSGDIFGEVALLKDEPRNATVKAVDSVDVFTLAKPDFLDATQKLKTFEEQLYSTMFNR